MNIKNTKTIQIRELRYLMQILLDKNLSSFNLYKELNDMGANPTICHIKKDTDVININMEKLFVFKLKYGLV